MVILVAEAEILGAVGLEAVGKNFYRTSPYCRAIRCPLKSSLKNEKKCPINSRIIREMPIGLGLVSSAGFNSYGQLGDNNTLGRSYFAPAVGVSNAVAIACGSNHSLVLRSDGQVFSCGFNNQGQLGDNTTFNRSIFAPVIQPVFRTF
jgi:hypothetical protein